MSQTYLKVLGRIADDIMASQTKMTLTGDVPGQLFHPSAQRFRLA